MPKNPTSPAASAAPSAKPQIPQSEAALLQGNYISQADYDAAKKAASQAKLSVVEYLLKEGTITSDLVSQAMAEFYHVPFIDLSTKAPLKATITSLPEDLARLHHLLAVEVGPKGVVLVSDNPANPELKKILPPIYPGKAIQVAYAPFENIQEWYVSYRLALADKVKELIAANHQVALQVLNEVFNQAITVRASDIHFEPQEAEVVIRFRVDGVLQEQTTLPKELYESILNRIKVLGHLRIDEHFSSQDGAIRYESNQMMVDMRVSIVPLLVGEKVVIRILSSYVKDLGLDNLGLSEKNQATIQAAAKKPFGMILVTGPTGSGKSTTLYALLKLLNKPEVNITTIEDPVEYRLKGVNQIQVNLQTNLTFAQGLRSIVRQDPNIILVGEIRDKETAEIAVNASLTGHLLLSTFHANDSSTAIPRLLEIGIEPFLLASTLELVIAQRLVRRICENCRYSETLTPADIQKKYPTAAASFAEKETTLYKGKGCNVCLGTGYKGRVAVYEFIEISDEMEELMLQNPSASQIWKLAQSQGATSLYDDGIEKVKNGLTTLEEVARVATGPKQVEPDAQKS